ncbi:MAG TPA: nickel pincer cofactor biosynthesis protein LarC [Blastocatellia bacterium]|nr:nickel pincer cofactor biosynthesis protein LarC [Blastocatellia bacterium]
MRILYLDCFAGISGDMTIGALLDLGLDFDYLKQELAKLGVEGYDLSLERVDRSGINAAKFDVHLAMPVHVHHHHDHDHHHHHDHTHEEHHSHDHRSLATIKHLIAVSALSDQVKQTATAIFERIGEAEAKIHGVDIESVHFHEVGAVDSIVDIVGACIGFEALGIEQIISSPLHVGYGTFTCAHGTYPIPGPAATEILRGVPIYANNIEGELVTPTGAAIAATLAQDFVKMPLMRIEKVGYGAGTRVYEKFPNVLRAVLGELEAEDKTPDTITVIEANLDDLNPQIFGHLMEQALAAGALDVFYTPVQMKKNRPGVLLTLLCATEMREPMMDLIFRETTTLGVRYREERRVILQREFVSVETPFGAITIKVARNQTGQVMNAAPEFADCQAAALKHQVSLREVQLAALKAYSSF